MLSCPEGGGQDGSSRRLPGISRNPTLFDMEQAYTRPSPVTQWKRTCLQRKRCRRHWFDPWVGKSPWRRAWQPTAAFLPGESHGQRTLAGYSPWGHRESDTTERLTLSLHFQCVLALPHPTSFFSDLFGRLCASMKEILPAILVNNRCGSHQAIIFQRGQQ